MSKVKKDTDEEQPLKTIYIFMDPKPGKRAEPIWLQQLRNLPAIAKKSFAEGVEKRYREKVKRGKNYSEEKPNQ